MSRCLTCGGELPAGKLYCARCGTPGGATLPMGAPPIRKINNRYEVIGSLGEGSYGSVFKVRDCQLEEILGRQTSGNGSAERQASFRAMKIPHESVVATEQGASRFLDEIRALINLSHPNIATIRDAGFTD